jgi:hypothetical protein
MGYYEWERKPNTHELWGMGDRIDPQVVRSEWVTQSGCPVCFRFGPCVNCFLPQSSRRVLGGW